jgi:hypothetical protein
MTLMQGFSACNMNKYMHVVPKLLTTIILFKCSMACTLQPSN